VLASFTPAWAVNIYDALQHIDSFNDQGGYLDVGTGGILKTGNTEFASLNGATYLGYRYGQNIILLSALAEYTEASGSKIADNSLEHLRFRRELRGPWSVEAYAQHERDLFRRIRLRALGGGAFRFSLPDWGGVSWAVGSGPFVETVRINYTTSQADSGESYNALRNSTYLTVAYATESRGRFGLTAYYQPKFSDLRDFRATGKMFLETYFSEHLKVELFFGAAHDTSAASAVEETDTTSGFKVSFALRPPKPARGAAADNAPEPSAEEISEKTNLPPDLELQE
jgi:hypothetical protein